MVSEVLIYVWLHCGFFFFFFLANGFCDVV